MKKRLDENEVTWFPKPVEGMSRAPVFFWGNLVFRAIQKQYKAFFLDFFSSGLSEKLTLLQLIPKTKISNYVINDFDLLIEQEHLSWTIYPQEWTFSMLREAAICVLKTNKICQDYGYETFDCHGFNILFNGSCPQFVDIGSFVKKESPIWSAMDEFVRCYLYPLKLWAEGKAYLAQRILSDNHWKRLYPEDLYYREGFEHLLEMNTDFDALIQYVSEFKQHNLASTWEKYHDRYHNQDGTIKENLRFDKIVDIVSTMDIKSAHDMGGNAGIFTQLLLQNTSVEKSLCSDMDANAVNSLFEMSHNNFLLKDKISCALLNVLSPIQNYGNKTIYERLKCDAVFALALLHHLVLVSQTPLEVVLEKLSHYTNKYIFIEFMPFSHLNIHSRKIGKEVEHYNEEWFASEFKKVFDIIRVERLELNRILFVGQKKYPVINNPILDCQKIKEKIDVPVMLIFQDEQDVKVLDELGNLEWTFFLVNIIGNNISSKSIMKIDKWLKERCHDYEIIKTPSKISDPAYWAIDRFFNKFEHGIIIENGFIPGQSFFKYCSVLLNHYQTANTVLQISGINIINNSFHSDSSYIFTHSFFMGAFATWKKNWIKFKSITDFTPNTDFTRLVNYYSIKAIDDWKYRWALFGITGGYFSIQPNKNLVKFVRKKDEELKYFDTLSTYEMEFPIKHPDKQQSNENYNTVLNADFFNPLLPFYQNALDPSLVSIAITSEIKELKLSANEKRHLKINIKNCGSVALSSLPPFPVNLSYRWFDLSGKPYLDDGLRTNLISQEDIDLGGLLVPKYLFLLPNDKRDYSISLLAPDAIGRYILKITAVQEGKFWLDNPDLTTCFVRKQVSRLRRFLLSMALMFFKQKAVKLDNLSEKNVLEISVNVLGNGENHV